MLSTVNRYGLQPTSDGLQPESDGVQLKSDGLQPKSNLKQICPLLFNLQERRLSFCHLWQLGCSLGVQRWLKCHT